MIRRVKTNTAPKAIGTYSQGSVSNGFIFTSGQIGIDPETGKLDDADFKTEVFRVLENLKAVIECGGSSINRILKLTVFLKDLSNFKEVNKVFDIFFNKDFPARSLIEVSNLPGNANIEIEAIAEIE